MSCLIGDDDYLVRSYGKQIAMSQMFCDKNCVLMIYFEQFLKSVDAEI